MPGVPNTGRPASDQSNSVAGKGFLPASRPISVESGQTSILWKNGVTSYFVCGMRRGEIGAKSEIDQSEGWRWRQGPRLVTAHQRVILTNDLAAVGLKAGNVGTVIHIHCGVKHLKWDFSRSMARRWLLQRATLHTSIL